MSEADLRGRPQLPPFEIVQSRADGLSGSEKVSVVSGPSSEAKVKCKRTGKV